MAVEEFFGERISWNIAEAARTPAHQQSGQQASVWPRVRAAPGHHVASRLLFELLFLKGES